MLVQREMVSAEHDYRGKKLAREYKAANRPLPTVPWNKVVIAGASVIGVLGISIAITGRSSARTPAIPAEPAAASVTVDWFPEETMPAPAWEPNLELMHERLGISQ